MVKPSNPFLNVSSWSVFLTYWSSHSFDSALAAPMQQVKILDLKRFPKSPTRSFLEANDSLMFQGCLSPYLGLSVPIWYCPWYALTQRLDACHGYGILEEPQKILSSRSAYKFCVSADAALEHPFHPYPDNLFIGSVSCKMSGMSCLVPHSIGWQLKL